MSENRKELSLEQNSAKENAKAEKKNKKSAEKKPNFVVRFWKRVGKFFKDVVGEMKKVVWTPKNELKKSTKLVLVIVISVAAIIAIIDTSFSWLINSIAGVIG